MTPPLARALGLTPHPEGGWFRRTWTAGPTLHPAGYPGPRASVTAIHYGLAPGEESRWHRVRSDELWLHQRGGRLELQLGGSGAQPEPGQRLVLGPDPDTGDALQALVPAGVWQRAAPAGPEPVLDGCVVTPGFDFADFTPWTGPAPAP